MEEKKLPDVLKKETTRRDFLRGTATAAGSAIAITAIGGIAPKKAEAQYSVQTAPGTKPYAQKYRFAERQNCTGCRSCEFACSLFHTGNVRPALSRIYIAKYKDIVDVPVMCWHCDDAPCIKACPTTPNSLTKDAKTNGIVLNTKTCLGAKCMKCAEACPPKYIRGNADTGQPLICDLCGGDPQCVKACQEQSGNPQGPCLMGRPVGIGVNMAFRDVTPEQAGKDLATLLFYPNVEGKRVVPAKTKKGR
jgi:Fe-S-cluster-containing hydrogenase component 2